MPYKLNAKQLKQKWAEYRQQCDSGFEMVRYQETLVQVPKPGIYCIEDFFCFAGIDPDKIPVYEKNKNFKAAMKEIKYVVLARKMKALVNGEGCATGLIFDIRANYGMYEKRASDMPDKAWELTLDMGDAVSKMPAQEAATAGPEDIPPPVEEEPKVPEPYIPPTPFVEKPAQYCIW